MAKGEISWKRVDPDGEKYQVYARHSGNEWRFFVRQKRFDNWHPMPHPPLEDWLHLMDGLERRVARRLFKPESLSHLKKIIREKFPDAELP